MSKKKLEPINYKWEPKAGDRVLDRMFPEYGPATLEQHPDPGSVMDGRDKWIIRYDDTTKGAAWVGKKMSCSQLQKLTP